MIRLHIFQAFPILCMQNTHLGLELKGNSIFPSNFSNITLNQLGGKILWPCRRRTKKAKIIKNLRKLFLQDQLPYHNVTNTKMLI